MPLLVFIWSFIATIIGPLLAKIIVALGISVVSYTGISLAFDSLSEQVMSNFSAIPQSILQLIGLFGVGVAIKMQLAAITAVIAYKTTVGAFSKVKVGGK